MASIGDVWLGLQLQGAEFQASAKKEGAKAGEAAGSAMSKGISGALGKLKLGASFVQGLGIGAGIGAFHALTDAIGDVVNAIPNMIHSGQDFAKTVDDISDATGSGAEAASRFAAAMIYTTGSAAGVSMGLKTLSKDLVANRAEFEKLGISITDANGAPRDTLAILEDVREFMATKLPAGYAKSALAIKLFGRSGLDFLDFLSMSNEQVGKFNSTVDAMGVTLSGPAVAAAESLAREQNLLGLAWQGLSNTLTTAVVPAIRQAIGGLTQFIVEHGAEIRQTLVDITQAVLGFVAGLVGIEGMTPFQDTLDGLAGSAGDAALTFDQWAVSTGQTIPKIDKVKTSTKGATDAIDKQIKTVEKAIEVEKRRDDASETIFQRTMRRLSAEYGAQLDALDLQERQLAMAERDKDLAEQLRQAKIDLFEAQAQRGADVTAGKVDDPTGVARAQKGVLDAQKAIADEAAQRDRDANRQRLEGVKSYIEDVARIEAAAENKKALARTLARRRAKLQGELAGAQGAGDATSVKDIQARLAAVAEAEKRTAAALASSKKQDELGTLRTLLQERRAAIGTANSGEVSDNKKKLAQMKADYQKYVDGLVTQTTQPVNMIGALIKGNAKGGTGLGGAIAKSFLDGQVAGENFRKFLADKLLPAISKIVDAFGLIVDALKTIADNADLLGKLLKIAETAGASGFGGGAPDTATANKLIPKFVASYNERHGGRDPSEAQIRQYLHEQGVKGFAQGAWDIPAGMLGRLDKGEMVVPEPFAQGLRPALSMSGANGGGDPAIIRVEVGGNKLLDYIDEGLSYRRRR